MKPEPTSISVDLSGGKKITFETGKLAKQRTAPLSFAWATTSFSPPPSPMPIPARASTSFRSRLITANTPTPADASPADSSSAKAVRASAKFSPAGRSIVRSVRYLPKDSNAKPRSSRSCCRPTAKTIRTSSASTPLRAALHLSDIPFLDRSALCASACQWHSSS